MFKRMILAGALTLAASTAMAQTVKVGLVVPYTGVGAELGQAIDRGVETDLATGLEIERMLFAGLFATRDREIGMTSFVEQGPGKAVFEGA